ncbi:MAG: NirD/YgiW/YdeI family stress tolerance protein [Leptolyngbyaceae cyanobacterium MO_188.B28]|nr:NirD/YgiW/YdeI family stress tolerance protein [Leptolyngbyaceae cyanobacterium MO_188.B28]
MNSKNLFSILSHKNAYLTIQSRSWKSQLSQGLFSLGISALGIVTFTAASSAEDPQFSGYLAQNNTLTIQSILAEPTDGMQVTLQGRVLQAGDDAEDYIFTDGTDQIAIEIHDDNFSFTPDTLFEITGEVYLEAEDSTQQEAHPEEIEIEVHQVRIVTP